MFHVQNAHSVNIYSLGERKKVNSAILVEDNFNIMTVPIPSAITQPFFELQTSDFAWKFVWTVLTNYAK